jgi:Protein of Unknown function (DUF2784)
VSRESLLIAFADAVLITHVAFVLFVVLSLVAVYVGYFLHWTWVRNRLFRVAHILAVGIVVVQSWIGVICPLTTWEMALRNEAGAQAYSGSFVQYWLQSLLYYSAPEWVFIALYTGFGSLVLLSWFLVKPD